MKCKFCERKAHARGLCGTHYGYARRGEAGLTLADMDPRKKGTETLPGAVLTDIQSHEMVRLFSEEFMKLRAESGISINALTNRSGITRRTIYRIENCYQNMRLSTFLCTLGTVPYGPALLHRLADKLEKIQADAKDKR